MSAERTLHAHIGSLGPDGSCQNCDWCTGCGALTEWTAHETCVRCGYPWGGGYK